MDANNNWLDIIEEAGKLKKGTKIPKYTDIYALTMLMYPLSTMARRQNINNQPVPMGQGPANGNQFNTGAGADGIVQASKPVALDTGTNPPSVYHEGETIVPFPGGKNIIPATTEGQQMSLGRIQSQRNLPGYATGGTVYDDPNSITGAASTRPTNEMGVTPEQNMYQSGVTQAFKTTQQRAAGTDPLMQNITNRALTNYDTRAAVSDTATRQALASSPYLTEGAKRSVTAKQQATYSAGLSGLVGDLSQQSMGRAETANTELYNMGRTGVQDELSKQQWQKSFGEQQYQSDVASKQWQQEYQTGKEQWQKSFDFEKQKYGDQEFARMSDDAQNTSLETWLQKYPNATESDYNTAREYKTLQLSSMNLANLTSSETLSQLKESNQWNQAQQFLAAGDYENYKALVKQITGKDIDTTTFESDRQYLESMRGYEKQAAAIQNDAARFSLTSATMQAVINDVNSGVPLNTINATYNPQPPLTQADYSSIATKYQQQVTSANLSIKAQNIANDAAALGVTSDRLTAFVNAVNSGADLAAANQASGLNLTQAQMNSISTKYKQEIAANALQLTNAQIVNEAAALGVSTDRLNSFVNAVNSGADLAAANQASGLNLTQTQLNSIATKYKQEIAANALQLTNAQIANEAAALGVSTDRMNSFINAVNNGSDLAAANQASGLNLTQNQLNSIAVKYQQGIKAAELQLTNAELSNEATALGISADRLNTFINAVNNGADLAAANATSGLNLSQTQLNSIAAKYQQELKAGQLQLTNAEIANEASALGVSADRLNVFINAVNNGADLAAANASSGLNLTQSQMNLIAAKYQQELAAGQLQLTNAQIANEAATLGVSADRLNIFINAVNNGSDLNAANAASGLSLTQGQMDSISAKYRQELKAGQLQLTNAEIVNEAAALGVSADRLNIFINAVNNGADLTSANATSGLSLNQTQLDSIATKYKQEIAANALQLTNAQIANEAATLGVSTERLSSFIDAVNSGADLAAANASSGLNLSQSQMDSISAKYRQSLKVGELTVDAQELANDAAKLNISSDKLSAFIAAANSGADLAAANSASGLNLSQSQMDSITTKYRMGIEEAQLALSETKNKVGDQMYQSIIDMINGGSSLQTVNSKLAEQGKAAISAEEFKSMFDASALGERNWGRDLTAANMLLTTPGIENKMEAEKAFGELFPSVELNFESLAQMDKAAEFTDALSQVATYVAAGLNYNDASKLIQESYLAEKLGMNQAEISNLYHAMEVNAIDSEWSEMEDSDFYKGLSTEEQGDLQEFFKQKQLGQLDYTTMHEYEIYNPDGTLNMTVYGADSAEADKKAKALGNGYTVNDTGRVKFRVTSTLTSSSENTSTKSTNKKWEDFQDSQASLPEEEQINYDQWESAKEPEDYDVYKSKESSMDKILSVDSGDSNALLNTKDNVDNIFAAYNENPDAFKNSDYYYELPNLDYLKNNIATKTSSTGKHSTVWTTDIRKKLEDSYGKIMTFNDQSGNEIVGQLVEAYKTPSTVQLKIRLADGAEKTYSIMELANIANSK
jgi:hypothetical protein